MASVARTPAAAAEAALLSCRAMLARADDDFVRAHELHHRAAAAWRGLPRPYYALRELESAAWCLLGVGREEGVAELRDVLRGYSRLGAVVDGERVVEALRSAGIDARLPGRRRGRPGYGAHLSPRKLGVTTRAELARAAADLSWDEDDGLPVRTRRCRSASRVRSGRRTP